MKRYRVPLSPADLAELGATFRAGGVVLVPTDTVYGVAAAPGNAAALARIVAAKGRDPSKPCQLLAASPGAVAAAGIPLPPRAAALARAFWPGALTLVLDLPQGGTEGVRVPDHPVARALCEAAGGALRCTSANRSGEPPARTAAEAEAALPEADAVVDAGPAQGGVASSVAKVAPDGALVLFREGALPRPALEAALASAGGPRSRWIWLDPARHPDLQFCEARRIAGRPRPEGQRGHAVVQFRSRVELPAGAGPVRLRVSADTVYRLRVNGAEVAAGPSPAAGDWAPLPRPAGFFADALEVPAAPVLDILATVRLGEARLRETSAGRGGFRLDGEAALPDGSALRFGTDEAAWRVRLLPAWRGPSYYDGSLAPGPWEAPAAVPDVWCEETAPIPVRETADLPPAAGGELGVPPGGEARGAAEWDRIHAGYVRLRADGPCEIEACPFETDPAAPHARESVRLGGAEDEFVSDLHSVGGVALRVRNADPARPVRVRVGLTATRFPVDPARAGSFRCSDEGLNRVWDLCRHTLSICRQNLHLDSPKHQEMLACAGDYHVETLMTAACFGDLRLAALDARRVAGILEAADGRLFHTTYGLVWVLWLRDLFRLTGDLGLVRDCRPALERLLRRFRGYLGAGGIVENPPDWMFVDWLVVDGHSLHHPPRALGQTAMNAWLCGALDAAADLLAALGDAAGSAALRKEAAALRAAARAALFDPASGLWLDGLGTPDPGSPPWRPANPAGLRRHGPHASILAALFGLSEGDEARAVLRRALDGTLGDIQPWFAHWALEAAARLGLFAELGMPLLRRWIPLADACPKGLAEGWTAPEPGYAFDHSHAWGGTPAWQLPVRLLGLRIEQPGMRCLSLAPDLFGLERADIDFPTPLGLLRVRLRTGEPPRIDAPAGLRVHLRTGQPPRIDTLA